MSMIGIAFVALGFLVFAVILGQVFMSFKASMSHYITEREQRELGVKLLKNKIEAMKALHIENKKVQENTWNGFRKFKVETKPEGGGVTSAYLRPHDGGKLPPFKPGQYLTFQLKLPNEEKPLIRCYSLSDGVSEDFYRVSVKKVPPPRDKPELPPGKSSTFFNEVLKSGDLLDVKAPAGPFFLEPREQFPVVLIGGGIGITPVYSMLKTLCDIDSEREVWFFYGVRNGKEAVYKQELKDIAKKHANVRMNICYSAPNDEDVSGEDYQHAERVSIDLFKRVLPSSNYDYYLCGPPPMMQSVVPGLEEWGVPEKKIHFEAFGPATVKKKKKPEATTEAAPAASAFKIKFSQSGKELDWKADAESILDFAEDNDISMSSGCRVGNCGTCMTAIKSGEVTYENEPGFEADAGSCLPCVCIPKGPVELDA